MKNEISERLLAFDDLQYKEKTLIREGRYEEVIAILRKNGRSGTRLAVGIGSVALVACLGLMVWKGEVDFELLFWVVFLGFMWLITKRQQEKSEQELKEIELLIASAAQQTEPAATDGR